MKALTPFIVIIISIAMYFIYISPTLVQIEELKSQKAEYTGVLEKTREIAQKRDAMIAAYNSIPQEDIEKLNKIIPEKFDPAFIAHNINAIAGKYGMFVKTLKADEPKTADRQVENAEATNPYKTDTISFVINGRYDQFIPFLRELESSLELFDVSNLSMKPIAGLRSKDLTFDYVVKFKTYSLQ